MPADKRLRSAGPIRVLVWLFKAFLGFVLFSVLWVVAYAFVPPPVTATMLGGPGIAKDWTPLSAIDPDMARAVIAAEDAKFCTHAGFDRDAIEDAWSRYRKGGRIRGGSTISQQTAKNAFLWQGGGFFRKGLEVWFTFLIEQVWGKQRIMEVYLNVAETGIGTYGVEAGARRYFGHSAGSLTPTEAARIAAVLPLPKARGAIAPTGFTRRYGNSILARMGVVRIEGLDDCLRMRSAPVDDKPDAAPSPSRSRKSEAALEALVPQADPLPDSIPAEEDVIETETDAMEERPSSEAEPASNEPSPGDTGPQDTDLQDTPPDEAPPPL